jgi:aspartate aminotransferase-like enzyme
MKGAFSDKWLDVAQRCGKPLHLQVPWDPIRAEEVDTWPPAIRLDPDSQRDLHRHDESAGRNRRAEEKYPDVLFIDAVSSMSAVPLHFDALGLDVLLAGTQKAFAMPPGLSVFVCSPAALAKAATAKDRGYYFDFVEFQKNAEQNMTPSTPSIGHVFALASKLEDIFSEGLEARYARHRTTNQMIRDWATKHGFTLFPEKGFESVTLTCVNNGARPGGRVVDVPKLQKLVKDQGFLIDGGYGKIKGTTFRISNMGDETAATMNQLFAAMDSAMKQL